MQFLAWRKTECIQADPIVECNAHSQSVRLDSDAPDDTGDTKLELPPPRKLLLSHPGWGSDDTKTFEKDRGGEHTHTLVR
jgi:hypothetical protein